jgi:hypothetical protein
MLYFATTSQKVPRQTATSFAPLHGGLLQCKCACGGTTGPTGECEQCRKKRESKTDHSFEIPPIVHEVLNSPGQQLDSATRAFMEPRFGHDFGNARKVRGKRMAALERKRIFRMSVIYGSDLLAEP